MTRSGTPDRALGQANALGNALVVQLLSAAQHDGRLPAPHPVPPRHRGGVGDARDASGTLPRSRRIECPLCREATGALGSRAVDQPCGIADRFSAGCRPSPNGARTFRPGREVAPTSVHSQRITDVSYGHTIGTPARLRGPVGADCVSLLALGRIGLEPLSIPVTYCGPQEPLSFGRSSSPSGKEAQRALELRAGKNDGFRPKIIAIACVTSNYSLKSGCALGAKSRAPSDLNYTSHQTVATDRFHSKVEPLFFDKAEAAAYLSVSISTFEKLLREDTTFPRPRALSANRNGYLVSELRGWGETRPVADRLPPANTDRSGNALRKAMLPRAQGARSVW